MTTILVYVACGVVGAALGHAAAWLIYLALDARERSRARLCGFLRGYWQAASGRALDHFDWCPNATDAEHDRAPRKVA